MWLLLRERERSAAYHSNVFTIQILLHYWSIIIVIVALFLCYFVVFVFVVITDILDSSFDEDDDVTKKKSKGTDRAEDSGNEDGKEYFNFIPLVLLPLLLLLY